jgi:hypothetical protein
VIETRSADRALRRRRECLRGHKFTTYEAVAGDTYQGAAFRTLAPHLTALTRALDDLKAASVPPDDQSNRVTWG